MQFRTEESNYFKIEKANFVRCIYLETMVFVMETTSFNP